MKRIIKNNYKIMIGFMLGILLSVTSVYAIDAYIESNKVTYKNNNKNNVQEAIDELYEKSGIHQEKWIDPILNGADPVLKSPLIPVEIKPNGDVYYANLNSEWYNYSEKRWANAVILVDNPSNKNYEVGDHIIEDDIESYFVWIPRYKYKVWDLGKYTSAIEYNQLINDAQNIKEDNILWKVAGSNSKLIDIVFGDYDYVKTGDDTKQGSGISGGDANVNIGDYLIHPAFKLGNKTLSGIWVGKFETGYKGANSTIAAQVNNIEPNSIIVKPNVYSWRGIIVKNVFMTAYGYEEGTNGHNEELDPHMMKNTEWGAVSYLSYSKYGIGNKVNINNNSEYKTGYSATANADQRIVLGENGTAKDKTQSWNTLDGYFASTTGNISGVYDMGGGAWEYVAACMEGIPNEVDSGFNTDDLKKYMDLGYIDKYSSNSITTSYDKRILGDATGELGPFHLYLEENGVAYYHSSWSANNAEFLLSSRPWFHRGGEKTDGAIAGQFHFARTYGRVTNGVGFRIVLAPTK